jgi:large subunit ribosomal protein L54
MAAIWLTTPCWVGEPACYIDIALMLITIALSSCAPGTVLTGLNILKDQPEVKALPDEEYPAWLWTILDKPKAADAELGMRRPAELKDAKDFAGYKKQLRSQ